MLKLFIYCVFGVTVAVSVTAMRIYDRMYNFVPAMATVTKVERVCYATRRTKRDVESLPMQPCEPLLRSIATDPLMRGFSVIDQSVVSLRYISPVDHEPHSGNIGRRTDTTLKVDDQVRLFVSLHRPTEFFE